MSEPAVAVCVPSHDRPLRLRWLLNALEEALPAAGVAAEVVVAHDSDDGGETAALLASHPLAQAGVLRALAFAPGSAGPAAKRNAAWRATRAPLIAFTDDDCRPPADWLTELLAVAREHPGAIVQGGARPDPEEEALLYAAALGRSQLVEPPTPWAQTCSILYPRELLERVGGFDEGLPDAAGEDTDLALRAQALGAALVAAPDAVTFHAVETPALHQALRSTWRWRHLPLIARRHPHVRREIPLRVFWKTTHAWLLLAAAGTVLAVAVTPWLALAIAPWGVEARRPYGSSLRGRVRSFVELPLRALLEGAEVAALAWGSVRYRSFLL